MDANGEDDPAVYEQVRREEAETNAKAARMCFEACKVLEMLWIGDDTRATVKRDANGGVAAVEVVDGLQRPQFGIG